MALGTMVERLDQIGCLLVDHIRELCDGGPKITSHRVCLLSLHRLATIIDGYLLTTGHLSILPIHKTFRRFGALLRMSFEWCFCRTFGLWSDSCQMAPLAI